MGLDGSFYVAGDGYLTRVNSNGTQFWTVLLPGFMPTKGLAVDAAGNACVALTSFEMPNARALVRKYSPAGSNAVCNATAAAFDKALGRLYVSVDFFDPDAGMDQFSFPFSRPSSLLPRFPSEQHEGR